MSHDRFSDWDAAYVLGALSPAERHEFEEHLTVCDECSASVTSLAAMPGLLAALPADEAWGLVDDVTSDDSGSRSPTSAGWAAPVAPLPAILPRLAASARRTRRRRLVGAIVGAAAAAAIVAGAIVVPPLVSSPEPTAEVALQATVPSPLTATVDFTTERWGTSITMNCGYYRSGSGDGAARSYGLYVTDRRGTTTRVSTWSAEPGSDVVASGAIETSFAQLARVEVRSEANGAVLLSKSL